MDRSRIGKDRTVEAPRDIILNCVLADAVHQGPVCLAIGFDSPARQHRRDRINFDCLTLYAVRSTPRHSIHPTPTIHSGGHRPTDGRRLGDPLWHRPRPSKAARIQWTASASHRPRCSWCWASAAARGRLNSMASTTSQGATSCGKFESCTSNRPLTHSTVTWPLGLVALFNTARSSSATRPPRTARPS